jgi:hypothetical protein
VLCTDWRFFCLDGWDCFSQEKTPRLYRRRGVLTALNENVCLWSTLTANRCQARLESDVLLITRSFSLRVALLQLKYSYFLEFENLAAF